MRPLRPGCGRDFDYRNDTAAWLIGLPESVVSTGCRTSSALSGGMLVLMENAAEAVVSSDVEVGHLVWISDPPRERGQRSGVREALMRPVSIVKLFELAQGHGADAVGSRSTSDPAARGGRSAPTAP